MNDLKNKTIGVFFGSRSPEHDISIITAQMIMAGLTGLGCEIVPIYISKRGEWLVDNDLSELRTFTEPKREINAEDYNDFYLDLEASRDKLVFRRKGITAKSFVVDIAFPALHGSYGEDGTIQGLFEMFNVPYVGCDVASSSITMDKILTKQFYESAGIPTVKFRYFTRSDWQRDQESLLSAIEKVVKYPVVVKPARLGSSIGIAKARNRRDLVQAIEVALHYDHRFLAEVGVENLMDLTVAVLGNDEPRTSLIQESVFADAVFSYEDKYLKEGGAQIGKARSNIVIPARLPEETAGIIRGLSAEIYKLFGCSGIARVDFLYDKKSGKYFANEVNTLPGTLYHHLWKASGIELDELLRKLVELAQEKHEQKQKITSTFESEVLRRARSFKLGIDRKM